MQKLKVNCSVFICKVHRHLQSKDDVACLQINNNQILVSQRASNYIPVD